MYGEMMEREVDYCKKKKKRRYCSLKWYSLIPMSFKGREIEEQEEIMI